MSVIRRHTRRESEQRGGESALFAEPGASQFVRSFTLLAQVQLAEAHARAENDVLFPTLPHRQGSAASHVPIQ
ncbi:Hsp20/alpha crystallin family protein [Massilia sp. CF038]|uniref:Hsp20/alpha crystallin family protein n=1 Tax=Massilia sp. CF038 TaxID=1881045 RepID=UPI000932E3ED|nr:Hsp20/alpha crystallin family protein [Massilia sp. CF038]